MKRLSVFAGIVLVFGLSASALLLSTETNRESETRNVTEVLASDSNLAVATFAGGCFWCVEAAFEKVPGVVRVLSGYSGGEETSPNYREVASGLTGHTEAVQIHYDDTLISYEGLLETLWRTADPTDSNGQFVDRGRQYRPEIFYHDESQLQAATLSRQKLDESGRYNTPVNIAITPVGEFYVAEEYHQDYYLKNPIRYKYYTRNSGRYQFIDSVWPEGRAIDYADYQPESPSDKASSEALIAVNSTSEKTDSLNAFDISQFVKPSDSELKQRLSPLEYKVTQKDGTERPFSNALHDEKRVGLYVDIVSGEPLFSSSDKFDSGTGWPSFIRPITEGVVIEKADRSLFGLRTEIRSARADSHLGHVFNDGPAPTGNRYCMNSAAMRFIPVEQMAESGYSAYVERVSGNKLSS